VDSDEVVYRPIKDFPRYVVGSDGSVWSYCHRNGRRSGQVKTPRRLAVNPKHGGYHSVSLRKNKKTYNKPIHLLVLTAFRGDRPDRMDGCHNNGDISDNRLENLRWDTRKGNHADKERHGTKLLGERNPRSKLAKSQVLEIRKRYSKGDTKSKLAQDFNVSRQSILDIVRRNHWRHV
jgi:hypothetical protein